MIRFLLTLGFALWSGLAAAQDITAHAVPVGEGPGAIGWSSVGPCTAGLAIIGQGAGADPICGTQSIPYTNITGVPANTFLGNNTGSTGPALGLTVNQSLALMTSTSGGGTLNFLRADGTWAVPPSSNVTGTTSLSGASITYSSGQNNLLVIRSNSGSPMSDTLPGTSPGVLPNNTVIRVKNADTGGVLAINVGSGATLTGQLANTGWIYICPGQTVAFYSNGTNYFSIDQPSTCILTANTTIFLAQSGSNTANGLTSGTPLASLQTAWNLLQNSFNANANITTLKLADGTYSGSAILSGPIPGQTGGDNTRAGAINDSSVRIVGNTTTPTNVVVTSTAPLGTINVYAAARVAITGMQISNTSGFYDLYSVGSWASTQNIAWGTASAIQAATNSGGFIELYTPYSIVAGSGCHIIAGQGGFVQFLGNGLVAATITLVGTPNFSSGFACAQSGYISVSIANSFSGAATGQRFSVDLNGVIDSGGNGTSYFPGNSAGGISSGGQYQ